MATGWFLNREEDPLQIGVYPVPVEGVHAKPNKVRTGQQSTWRPDAGILAEPSLRRLTCHFNNNLLVFCNLRPSNFKRKQNWYEFNIRCMVDVKSPSQVGSKQHQIGTQCVILTLSHNTIGITPVDSDGGRVWVVTVGHVVTILSMGTRIRENGRCQRRSVAVKKDSWRRSGRSCYEWQADLSGRCWVRLDCNGGFKGWSTTLNPGRFV